MDILGQDNVMPTVIGAYRNASHNTVMRNDLRRSKSKYRNAATDDLSAIDSELSKLLAEITTLNKKILDANAAIKKCQDGGILYSCLKNTGKSVSTWVNYRNSWQATVTKLNAEVDRLKAERVDALNRIKAEAIAAGQTAEAAGQIAQAVSLESQASATKAMTAGKWIGVGLGAIALGALIWFKIIKKK